MRIVLFVWFTFYSLSCNAQYNKSDHLDIDLDKFIINFSIQYIWKDDSLAIKDGRAWITEYLVSKQYFADDSLATILKLFGPPYKITLLDSITKGYVYISNARKYENEILNVEILQININTANNVINLNRYYLDSPEELLDFNK